MALSLSFITKLPGGHKKANRLLCEVLLARSSLAVLDLQVSRATAAGMSLAPGHIP